MTHCLNATHAPQLTTGLPRLSALSIHGNLVPADGYSGLTRLSALTRLQLKGNAFVPACLGQLTGLQALVSSRTCFG